MRKRNVVGRDLNAGGLSPYQKKIIGSFYSDNRALRSEKLMWEILGLVRRPDEATPHLVARVKDFSEEDRMRFWKLAYKWLSPPDHDALHIKLKDLAGDHSAASPALPYGLVRGFQERVRGLLRDVL